MEFKHLSVLALFCFAFVGIGASQSAEDYWQSVWPNTPLPKALSDLLLPSSETDLPIRVEEEKQKWTIFFDHDLYPGKKMSLGFDKISDSTLILYKYQRKTSQPFISDAFCGSGNPAAYGEDKFCATSLESMIDFAISKLGTKIKVISSSFPRNEDQYVVEEVKKIGEKAVMCHRFNLEKVVFYCHQVNATTTYTVPLVASDGTKAEVLAICHHDTRGIDYDMLNEIVKVSPGTVPLCHFIGNKAVAFIPDRAVSESDDHPCVI